MCKQRLEDIGFYTLCDDRAKQSSEVSPMWRCELIITSQCNFSCPYCRGVKPKYQGMITTYTAKQYTSLWAEDGLKHIRYSGGEPTCHPNLPKIISHAKKCGIERIAISTNGSQSFDYYKDLYERGVNDFSISLDTCCSSFCDTMTGRTGLFDHLIENISNLAKLTYVTVGLVINQDNAYQAKETIELAHSLGVADIRIIPSAQSNLDISFLSDISDDMLNSHPILKYRINNLKIGIPLRGIQENDASKCYLLQDDSVILAEYHFPCVIYLREGGNPIGKVNKNMRKERIEWLKNHDVEKDPICKKNCLDVCRDYNNKYECLRGKILQTI